jgi:hypothetical protein
MIKMQKDIKNKTKPGRRTVCRGTTNTMRRQLNEVWDEMVTYFNLSIYTPIKSKITHISLILSNFIAHNLF